MPVTFKVATHNANEFKRYGTANHVPDAQQIVSQVWRSNGESCNEMLQSSYQASTDFIPDSNGFVNTVLCAYNNHHNLVVRPDDLWTSILSQLNLYVNTHAEELRSKFVAHEGKKELVVTAAGDRYSVDFGQLAQQMGNLLKKNIVDPSLHEWIIPNFTTTTPNDVVVCSVMMMSTLKAYFSYRMRVCCGIPSITLLGEKADYISILQRTEKLAEFGEEPATFARLLQPILQEFCDVFDSETLNHDFWSRICHYRRGGSGPSYLGGWVSTFAAWTGKGKWQGGSLQDIEKPLDTLKSDSRGALQLVWAGLRYPLVRTDEIPYGFCDVDVTLDDNGALFDCKMVAGHVGYMVSTDQGHLNHLSAAISQPPHLLSSMPTRSLAGAVLSSESDSAKDQAKQGDQIQEHGQNHSQEQAETSDMKMPMNTLQPASHWFMFIKGTRESEAEARRRMMSRFG